MRPRRTTVLAAFTLAAAAGVPRDTRAQEAGACVRAVGRDTSVASGGGPSVTTRDTTRAALRILASVHADEMRFARSPTICVRLTGDAQLDSVRVLARRNLASPVVAGTSYRNVYVAVEILGHLDAECIAARITGTPRDTTAMATRHCAALEARTSAGAPP